MASAAALIDASALTDLVDRYSTPGELPPPEWLRRLNLAAPRRNLQCLSPATRFGKRALDLALGGLLFALLLPVMFVVAMLVRLTSPGPIILRQVRTGLNQRGSRPDRRRGPGTLPVEVEEERRRQDRRQEFAYGKPFVLYKFRTMRVDAESQGARLAVPGDPRVTPVGRFLRLTRLDELPQLWNVLRGDMSLVGPRPERPEFIETLSQHIPGYLQRLGLKPGLTGLAQILNGYDNNLAGFRRKVALDLLYLQNCCLWNDLKILWRTIGVVLTGKGAL